MARTKYKLGTFVKIQETEDAPAHFGAVEEIRMTTEGTVYKVVGIEDPVMESDIAAAYREVTPRKTATATKKLATAKSGRKLKSAKDAAEAA